MTTDQKNARLKRLWDDRFPHLPSSRAMLALVFLAEGEQVLYADEADYLSVEVNGVPYRVEYDDYDRLTRLGWIAGDDARIGATEQGRYWVQKFLREADIQLREKTY